MTGWIPHWWLQRLRRSGKNGAAYAVAICLACHYNVKLGASWPSLTRIAEETGFTRRNVVHALDFLEREGLITRGDRGRGPRKATHYVLNRGDVDSVPSIGVAHDTNLPTNGVARDTIKSK